MKKISVFILLFFLMPQMLSASETYRQSNGNRILTATGRAYATIVAPISVNASKDLTFGMLVKNKTGQVRLNADGSRTSTGPGLATSKPAAGTVRFRGPKGHLVTVNVSESKIFDNDNNALSFKADVPNGEKAFVLDGENGEAAFHIGGTLKVNTTEATGGTRQGVYVVQASY